MSIPLRISHANEKASPEEVGCFMLFAWPILLFIFILQGFFYLIGRLFGEK